MTDPISDMLTRIRNAVAIKKGTVEFPASKIKTSIIQVMKEEGFISNFEKVESGKKISTKVSLKYNSDEKSVINGLNRVSTPGLRSYAKKGEVPMYMGGLAVSIVSTSKGVMTGNKAYKNGLGGEVICYLW
jgi:small subunit ribosomal protein S8